VRHALKTVINSMRSKDRLAIILFDDRIQVPYDFTELTDDNRKAMLNFADTINKRGSTNIFDALKKSIDLIMARSKGGIKPANDAAVLFFTDG
jgi:uncharacterized protein YegL